MIGIICLLSTGYAAFSSNFLVSGKGKIVIKSITIEDLKKLETNSGNGLYKSLYDENKYVYRGSDPNNYIEFSDNLWQIISIESNNTIKLISYDSIGEKAWDVAGNRSPNTSTYCQHAITYGCNAWSATQNIVGSPTNFIMYSPYGSKENSTETLSGTVTGNSSLNDYLNTEYYSTLKQNNLIVNNDFYIGNPGNNLDEENFITNLNQIKNVKWDGKIGLINILDYMEATLDSNCKTLKESYSLDNTSVSCSNENFLHKNKHYWTISATIFQASPNKTNNLWFVREEGATGISSSYGVTNAYHIFPVIHLDSNIELIGEGTKQKPYKIVNN